MNFKQRLFVTLCVLIPFVGFGQQDSLPQLFVSTHLNYSSVYQDMVLSLAVEKRIGKHAAIEIAPEFYLFNLKTRRVASLSNRTGDFSGGRVSLSYLMGGGHRKPIYTVGLSGRYARFKFVQGSEAYSAHQLTVSGVQEIRYVFPNRVWAQGMVEGGVSWSEPIGGSWAGGLFAGGGVGVGYCF